MPNLRRYDWTLQIHKQYKQSPSSPYLRFGTDPWGFVFNFPKASKLGRPTSGTRQNTLPIARMRAIGSSVGTADSRSRTERSGGSSKDGVLQWSPNPRDLSIFSEGTTGPSWKVQNSVSNLQSPSEKVLGSLGKLIETVSCTVGIDVLVSIWGSQGHYTVY